MVESNLHYTEGITLKRVTSGEAHIRDFAPGDAASKKRCSGAGEPLATITLTIIMK